MRVVSLCMILTLVLVCGEARAISFAFKAVFTEHPEFPMADGSQPNPTTFGDTSYLPEASAGLSHGDIVTGTFGYDLNATPQSPSGPYPGNHMTLHLPAGIFSTNIPLLYTYSFAADVPSFWGFSPEAPLAGAPDRDLTYTVNLSFWSWVEPPTQQPLPVHFPLSDFNDPNSDPEHYFAGSFALALIDRTGGGYATIVYSFRIIEVTETPLPSAIILFGTGMTVIGLAARRRYRGKLGSGRD